MAGYQIKTMTNWYIYKNNQKGEERRKNEKNENI